MLIRKNVEKFLKDFRSVHKLSPIVYGPYKFDKYSNLKMNSFSRLLSLLF